MKRPARTTIPAAEALERRYRRLFACYPASYRATSEDEMLGVAMAGTKPGQRWPTLGEVRSLILGGARMRLSGLLSWARTPAWRDGCAAFAFLAAALLATISLEALTVRLLPMMSWVTWRATGTGSAARLPLLLGTDERLTAGAVIPAVIWPLAAVAAAMGWRRVTAVGASAGAGVGAVELAVQYTSDPSSVVAAWWQFVLAVTAALAAVTWLAASSDNGGARRLSIRVMAAVAAAGAVVAAAPAVQAAFITVTSRGPYLVVSSPLFGISGYLRYAMVALMGATLLVAAARLGPAVRRRVLLLSVPALAAGALVHWTFGGFLASSPRFTQPVLLTAPQWTALAAVPVLGLVTGMIWLGRQERMLQQLAAQPADPPLSGSAA
jgi:hypothetical protein